MEDSVPELAGLRKDRHHGTSGDEEGFSSIDRKTKKLHVGIFCPFLILFEILNDKFRPIHPFLFRPVNP